MIAAVSGLHRVDQADRIVLVADRVLRLVLAALHVLQQRRVEVLLLSGRPGPGSSISTSR